MNKRDAICEFLRNHHKGRLNAVHSETLEQLFLCTGRSIRRYISSLRKDGYPICSDENGYYYADNQDEINDTVARLNEFVTKVSNARTGMLYASVIEGNTLKLEININLIGGEKLC